MTYQSPIQLTEHTVSDAYSLSLYGTNRGAIFIDKSRIYIMNDDVFLTHHNKTYRLHEYHFHIPSEHVTKHAYDAEVHYVFSSRMKQHVLPYNVCEGYHPDSDILIMGVMIRSYDSEPFDPAVFQAHLPERYFEYDGVVGDKPIRWVIGKHPIHCSIESIQGVSKPARPTQSLDHRMVLYAHAV